MSTKKGAQQGAREIRVSKVLGQRVEVRKDASGATSLQGFFCSYNITSHPLGGFVERLAPGCFDKSLRSLNMTALVDHDQTKILGKVGQNLEVESTSKGLRFTVRPLPDTTWTRDVLALASESLLSGCSFGFSVDGPDGETWSQLPDGTPLRTIVRANIFEGSILTGGIDPAYPQTVVSARALRKAKAKRDDLDDDPVCDPDSADYDPDADCDEDRDCDCDCAECSSDAEDACTRCVRSNCDFRVCARGGCPAAGELDTLRMKLRIHQHRAKSSTTR